MAKITSNIILIAAFAFAGSSAFASTSTIPVDAAGNVGFGTTVPAARLQVGSGATPNAMNITGSDAYIVGNIEVDGKIYGDGGGLTSVPGFLTGLTASYVPRASGASSVVNSVIYADGTNVGINSATLSHRLAVDGNVYINGNLGIGSVNPAQQLDLGSGSLRLNTTNSDSVKGVIYKGTTPFLHNFYYTQNSSQGQNFFFGPNAGNFTMTAASYVDASLSTGVGANALSGMTTGNRNIAVGWNALSDLTTGSYAIVVGNFIRSAAAANFVTAFGSGISPGYNATSGLAFGAEAFKTFSGGSYGVAVGARSSYGTTSGSNGVSVGYETIGTVTGSVVNYVLLGYRAGYGLLTGGDRNILIGSQAGDNVSTGTANVMIGYDIEAQSATQIQNLSIGNLIFGTGLNGSNTTASTGNIGIATHAPTAKLQVSGGDMLVGTGTLDIPSTAEDLYVAGNLEADGGLYFSGNIGLGSYAPTQNIDMTGSIKLVNTTSSTTGVMYRATLAFIHDHKATNTDGYNTFLGIRHNTPFSSMARNAGVGDTSASYNTTLGHECLRALTYGRYNTALGYGTLPPNTTGSYNTAAGIAVMNNAGSTTGSYNTGLGGLTFYWAAATGNSNTALGYGALQRQQTGTSNTGVGSSALQENRTGNGNTAAGYAVLRYNTTGSLNTAIGSRAGSRGAIAGELGSNNVFIGKEAGLNIGTTAVNSNNILIGYATVDATGVDLTRNIIIGYNIDPLVSAASDQMSIGNLIFGAGGLGSGVVIGTGNVGIGTNLPVATFEIKGSSAFSVAAKTSDYTATLSDHTILVNAASGSVTVTLPAASGAKGRVYQIKKTDTSGNSVSIVPSGADQVEGAASLSTATPYQAYTLISDGAANWRVI